VFGWISIGSLNITRNVAFVPSDENEISLEPNNRPDPVWIIWIFTWYSQGPWIDPYRPKPTTYMRRSTINLKKKIIVNCVLLWLEDRVLLKCT
jgi:hypothetical protein